MIDNSGWKWFKLLAEIHKGILDSFTLKEITIFLLVVGFLVAVFLPPLLKLIL